MNRYDHYIPIILAIVTILTLGCWNPQALQTRNSNGSPNYLWLSLFAFCVGIFAVWIYDKKILKRIA